MRLYWPVSWRFNLAPEARSTSLAAVKKRGKPWWEQEVVKGEDLSADATVTQCGKAPDIFNAQPRFAQEFALSVIEGALDVEQAVHAAFRRSLYTTDIVRHFVAGDLQSHDYWVYRYPTRPNPLHGRISAPVGGASVEAHKAWWERPERVTLEQLVAGPEVQHVRS